MTTATATNAATISSRSRNLGYGWTNQPERYIQPNGESGLRIQSVDKPDVTGGLASIEAERNRARRINNGNWWNERLFVAGRPITAIHGYTSDDDYETVRECWYRVDSDTHVDMLLSDLRRGESVTVRLGEVTE